MSQSLAPCPSCSRHVRVSEESCPFCKAALAPDGLAAKVVPAATSRLSRAAAFAFTASVAVVGCTAGSSLGLDGGAEGGTEDASTPKDSGKKESGFQDDAGQPDEGGFAPPYGVPAYGLPPPSDSGVP